jgi:hypothetical protein
MRGFRTFQCEALELRRLMAVDGPIISEFVASNATGIVDADGEFSDWLEIHNPTAGPIDMTGWRLTDTASNPALWTFPAMTLAAGERRIVFASDKNRTDPAGELHTNFKLSAGGEYLALLKPDGVTATSLFNPFPAQSADVSFGVPDSDPDALRFFSPPTPGAPNGEGLQTQVTGVRFGADRGFFDAPFALTLATDTAGASIRYTLDGTAPSPTSGVLYTGPLNVATTATVRAIAYKTGFPSSKVDTRTYIFLDDVIRQPATVPNWPNPQIATAAEKYDFEPRVHDYEMDPRIVNDPAYEGVIKKGLTDIPTVSLVLDQADMWDANGEGGFYRLDDVEVPVSMEIIDPKNPSRNMQVNAGVEGHSHDRMKRSMRLHFRGIYGASSLVSKLIQDAPLNGDSATDEFNQIVLRGGNQRSWARWRHTDASGYAEDQWYRDTQVAMSGVGARGNFVHVYINGLYWGLYNATERPDDNFQAGYFGGNDTDYFAVKEDGPKDGDPARWNYLVTTLKNKDMSVLSNYRELEQYLDTRQFADYLLLNFYARTHDWPNNNFWAGNRNTPEPTPTKFFAWDGEFSFGLGAGSNTHGEVHHNFEQSDTKNSSTWPIPNLFNSAKHSREFLTVFADQAYRHLFNGGVLSDAASQARWDTLTEYIEDAIVAESARWGDIIDADNPRTRNDEWQAQRTYVRNWFNDNVNDLVASLRSHGYYPQTNPATFGQRGGVVAAGYGLTLHNPHTSGTIYYTTDGSDPRAVGGAVSGTARAYAGPITLNGDTTIRLRILRAGEWSALDEATFTTTGTPPPPPTQTPFKGSPFAVGSTPVTIQAEDYDLGGQGVAFNDTTLSNIGGFYRPGEPVDIKSHASGQFRISDAVAGEWLEYSIDVTEAGDYELEFRVSHADPSSRFHAEVDGADVTGSLVVPDTNSFNTLTSVKKTVGLASGQHVLRVHFDANASNGYAAGFDWVKVSRVIPPTPGTYDAAAASHVRDGSYAGQNFGTANELVVKRSRNVGNTRETYLKFDLSGAANPTSAKLRLNARLSDTSVASLLAQVYSVSNTSWSETGITWNNKPTGGLTLRGSFTTAGTSAAWYEVDLTSFLQSEFAAGRKLITLVLRNPNISDAQTLIPSDETANGPQLVLA